MTNISFGPALLTDALRISILMKTVYIETYGEEGISFEFANFITQKFSPAIIENNINENPDRLIVAYYNNNPIGVAEILYNSVCPIRKSTIPELGKLYVLKRFYGKKIGQGLLMEAEKLVMKKNYSHFYLEVYLYNERAIAFYKKHGYHIIGEVDFPMETNTYRNFVMTKEL